MASQSPRSASPESAALAAWLRSRGAYVHRDLELFGDRRDGVRGVLALSPIPSGSPLIVLPGRACIRACEVGSSECKWMPQAVLELSPVLRVTLFIMRELEIGAASDWSPYLQGLPQQFDTLEFWNQNELALLSGTGVYDEIAKLRDPSGDLIGATRVLWDKSIAPIVERHPELWPNSSLEAFLRTCAAVRTRGFFDTAEGGGGPYMLPAIDLLNHSRASTCTGLVVERGKPSAASHIDSIDQADASSGKAATLLGLADGDESQSIVFSMHADRDLSTGEELLHTYDDFDNSSLLLSYGYVAPCTEAPLAPTARVKVEVLLAACAAVRDARHAAVFGPPWDLRIAWVERERAGRAVLATYDGVVAVSEEEPLPDALVTVPQLMLMPFEDFAELCLGASSGDHDVEPPSASAECESDGQAHCEVQSASDAAESSERTRAIGRPPLLDSSALEDEPDFAALVVEALIRAIDVTRQRYPSAGAAPADCEVRRVRAAETLRAGEQAALDATQRCVLKLLTGTSSSSGSGSDEADCHSSPASSRNHGRPRQSDETSGKLTFRKAMRIGAKRVEFFTRLIRVHELFFVGREPVCKHWFA